MDIFDQTCLGSTNMQGLLLKQFGKIFFIIVAECVFCNVTPFFYLCFILSNFFVDGFLDILGKFILSFLQLFMVGRCVINFTGMCV